MRVSPSYFITLFFREFEDTKYHIEIDSEEEISEVCKYFFCKPI